MTSSAIFRIDLSDLKYFMYASRFFQRPSVSRERLQALRQLAELNLVELDLTLAETMEYAR